MEIKLTQQVRGTRLLIGSTAAKRRLHLDITGADRKFSGLH
jgi:hypothetical protein